MNLKDKHSQNNIENKNHDPQQHLLYESVIKKIYSFIFFNKIKIQRTLHEEWKGYWDWTTNTTSNGTCFQNGNNGSQYNLVSGNLISTICLNLVTLTPYYVETKDLQTNTKMMIVFTNYQAMEGKILL